MFKIVIASDNHHNFDVLKKIVKLESDADYYYHLGDSEADRARDIEPWVSIRGNNDFNSEFPINRRFTLNNKIFYMEHGHHIYYGDYHTILAKAHEKDADIILFGHTHKYLCIETEGVLMLNPGSCYLPRDYSNPSYAILYLEDDGSYKVERKYIDQLY